MAKKKEEKAKETAGQAGEEKKSPSTRKTSARSKSSEAKEPKKTARKTAAGSTPKKKAATPRKKTDPAAATKKRKTATPAKPAAVKRTAAPRAATKKSAGTPSAESVTRAPQPVSQDVQGPSPAAPQNGPEDYRRLEEDPRELPLEYGETKLVLLTRDPEWIFAYWEMSPETRQEFGLPRGHHSKHLILRIFDLALGAPGQGAESFDVAINDYTSSWYIRVPKPGTSYAVQLGILEGDHFRVIAASNTIHIPRRGISEETDVQFAEINDEVYQQIVHLSGGARIGKRLGSDEFLRSLQQRVMDTLAEGPFSSAGISSGLMYGESSALLGGASGEFSGVFHEGFGSDMLGGGPTAVRRGQGAAEDRDFWLEVGVDVVVYGATEPDARVSIMGQEIRLTPDGTFRLRMVLPDSTVEFPIEAQSPDGREVRRVKPIITRTTEGDPRKPA